MEWRWRKALTLTFANTDLGGRERFAMSKTGRRRSMGPATVTGMKGVRFFVVPALGRESATSAATAHEAEQHAFAQAAVGDAEILAGPLSLDSFQTGGADEDEVRAVGADAAEAGAASAAGRQKAFGDRPALVGGDSQPIDA